MTSALLKRLSLHLLAVGLPLGASIRAEQSPIRVAVSIAPQSQIVQQIGGDRIEVTVLLPKGQSPELYDPSPRLMASLSEVAVYFTIGLPFETNLVRRFSDSHSNIRIVNVDDGLPRRVMEAHRHESQEHSEEHGIPDPHTWLDPIRVKAQAETVCRALIGLSPADSVLFSANLAAVQRRLDSLDAVIRDVLGSLTDRRMRVFHPAYGYFADRYGLTQIAVESEGKEPSARELAELLDASRRSGLKALFVQPQFSQKTARTIADALGCRVVPLDPLMADYFAGLGDLAETIAAALAPEQERP